ncbi:unnamed protein product [marine sediment metagenome]|uniref:Uncharacterized protein n=1 Tax=marine sediment metagenome TaxID=412755 RepID=X1S7R1_9ZZZZ
MASTRGYAKRDILRAAENAKRIPERIAWLYEKYEDCPEFIKAVKQLTESSFMLERALRDLVGLLP